MFSEFCSEEGLDNTKKYADEKWSEYLKRLRYISNLKGIEEKEIIKKIRRERAPKDYQIIFHSVNTGLNDVISRIESWEETSDPKSKNTNKNSIKDQQDINRGTNKTIKCFNCNKIGHIARNCFKSNKQESNMMNQTAEPKGVDTKHIEINGFEHLCVFDSGSSVNMVSSKIFDKLNLLIYISWIK